MVSAEWILYTLILIAGVLAPLAFVAVIYIKRHRRRMASAVFMIWYFGFLATFWIFVAVGRITGLYNAPSEGVSSWRSIIDIYAFLVIISFAVVEKRSDNRSEED